MARRRQAGGAGALLLLALAALAAWHWWPHGAEAPAPAAPPEPPPKGLLAVVIDDWGYQAAPIRRLASLPGPLTLAVIPDLAHSRAAAEAGKAAGFELILHCPMAAKGGGHPEPSLLLPGLSALEVRSRLEQQFLSVPGAVGLNNHEGSLATEDRALMDAVAAVLKDRGAYFLDSLTTSRSAIPAAAKAAGLPWASRRVFLDNVDEAGAVRTQLLKAAELALKKGSCIAIGHPREATLDVLEAILPGLRARGIALVPVSRLLKRP